MRHDRPGASSHKFLIHSLHISRLGERHEALDAALYPVENGMPCANE
jgi:hypothetical protein